MSLASPVSIQRQGEGTTVGRRPKVVALLPRGEAIRNFAYTQALDQVAEKVDLAVLSVRPGDEIWGFLASRYPSLSELQDLPERWLVRSLRGLLDAAHGRWLWSEAARERWRLRDLEADTPQSRLKRWGYKLACYPFAHRAGLEMLSAVERGASRWLRTTDAYLRLFQDLQPCLVFNGSHVHSQVAIQAVQAAQWLRIPTATFIFSWDNLTSQGRVIPAYDHYLVWNEAIRQQLLSIYPSVCPDQVTVVGTPQFDSHFRPESYWSREQFCSTVGADPARPIILYTTGMANHMPGEPTIVAEIAAMLRGMREFGPPQLLVRVYPKDRTGRFEELKRSCPEILFPEAPWDPRWLTPRPEDLPLLTNSLRHAAVGINVASTVSLELCMFDKPVINVGYNPEGVDRRQLEYRRYYDFDHYRPVVESGAVQVAYSPSELRALLLSALTDPKMHSPQRRALIAEMFGATLDGRSASRAAEQLVTLARTGAPSHV
jgi:hypothetical protein